ncbi:MAG: hypothetical protein HY434_01635 [Candidatus Liptonbacteria bacterium]|nr:hypothetical protein [Candidatus Liptonbacteria bacterium]
MALQPNEKGKNGNGVQKKIYKFLFVSWESLSGDLAWQIKKEGHEVRAYIKETADADVYDGVLEKVPDWKSHIDWADVIVFDDVGFGAEADRLRKAGKAVVGGSSYTDRLEEDREFGQAEMKRLGMLTLPSWNFSNYDDALELIKNNPGRYVYKPSGLSAGDFRGLLLFGKEEDGKDLYEILEQNRKVLEKRIKQFQLQKFASGVEVAVGAFFNGNEFIYPVNINFEHKKLFPGELGEMTGEMGCYDEDTEVLTEDGWKFFKELKYTDSICTLNPRNHKIQYHRLSAIVVYDHHKRLVSVQNQTLDIAVTLDHNMYVCDQRSARNGEHKFKFVKAKDLQYQSVIKRTGRWDGPEKKFFILPSVSKSHYEGRGVVDSMSKSMKIPMDEWLAFMGIWLSDGYTSGRYGIGIAQKIPTKTAVIEKLLQKMPFAFKRSRNQFYAYNKQLHEYLAVFGKAHEKYVPLFIKNLSSRQMEIFLKWYCLGDGTVMRGGFRIFYTSSKKMADDLQELLLKTGRVGIIKKRSGRGKVWIQDHYANSSRVQYEILERVKKLDSWIDRRDIKTIDYAGKVYCATVKNHIMYVRRNGKPYWCGNTSMFWSAPNKLFKETTGRMEEELRKAGYVGCIDINCMVNGRGIYPLEYTSRFGYPTISIMMEGVTSEWGEFLHALANHEPYELKTKKGFQVGVVCVVPPFPYEERRTIEIYKDLSILFKKPGLEGIHLGDVKLIENTWRVAGHSSYVLVVTGSGSTMNEACKQAYARIDNIMLINMFYRTDIGLGWYEDSDKLQTWGYLY